DAMDLIDSIEPEQLREAGQDQDGNDTDQVEEHATDTDESNEEEGSHEQDKQAEQGLQRFTQ
ncbi:MAG: hypothetical protein SVU32_08685, partial [Candidatus Nanohaloarchaea archaeon]|nr:hypothetical protein [Candidatus Nanohaloarchaea archaeon]